MIPATSIEFIKNLAQYDYNGHYYDFHNDYNCEKLSYSKEVLELVFRNLSNEALLSLKFIKVNITMIDCFNVNSKDGLTLDNLYRGRVEVNGILKETSNNGKGYFYLEFYEGQKLEFWAGGMSISQ